MEEDQEKTQKIKLEDQIKPIVLMNKKTGQQFIIGFVDAIHGKGAKKFTVELTQFELEIVAKHWVDEIKRTEHYFDLGYSGSTEIRMYPYANSRLDHLSQFLGEKSISILYKTKK